MMKHRLPMGACVVFVACAVFLVGCGKEAEERAARAEAEARALQAARQALTERNEQLERDIEATQAERDTLKAGLERDIKTTVAELRARLAAVGPAKHLPQQAAPAPAPIETPRSGKAQAAAAARRDRALEEFEAFLTRQLQRHRESGDPLRDMTPAEYEEMKADVEAIFQGAQEAGPQPAGLVVTPTKGPKPAESEAGASAADRQSVAEARQRLDDLGAVLFERGELNIALAVSQSAFELGANSPQVLYRIAYCKAAAGQYEFAAEWYERVLAALGAGPGKDDELLRKCLNNYGVTQQRLGKPDKAAEFYQRALALDQAYAPAYFNLGLIYANELNRPADAVEAFRKHVIYGGTRSVTARAMIQKLLPRTEAATPAE